MESRPTLTVDSVTFGKYRNQTLSELLRDRSYCKWLVKEDWFQTGYPYLCDRVREYDPRVFFYKGEITGESPWPVECYFALNEPGSEKLNVLSALEAECYKYYFSQVKQLEAKIQERKDSGKINIYDIKAPSKWLQNFEKESGLKRGDLKEFMATYDLPTVTTLVEKIKAVGGVVYNGNNAYKIAMRNSKEQESYWEVILKEKYGNQISSQFKFRDCIFDFLNISASVIYECKLGLKDFNTEQYKRYTVTLDTYNVIYLIARDCVINISEARVYTTDPLFYTLYLCDLPLKNNPTEFDALIADFEVVSVVNISDVV